MKRVKCQRTGVEVLLQDGAFVASPKGEKLNTTWEFVGPEAEGVGSDYSIPVGVLCKSPEAFLAWVNQLSTKPWFDAGVFFTFCANLAKENHLHSLTGT